MKGENHSGAPARSASGAPVRAWPGDRRVALLVGLLAFLVYNANLRFVTTGDSLPARFLPLVVWTEGSLYLDSVLDVTVQRHPAPYWILAARGGHIGSMYPVVTPLVVTPLYGPAVLYLNAKGWTYDRVSRVGALMEKLSSTLLVSLCVALMYLLLRRRAGPPLALALAAAFAFGTNTWTISSQALWQHGTTELLLVVALLCVTGRPSWPAVTAAGLACGLVVANRLLDVPLAAAVGVYALFWWSRRRWPVLVVASAVPVALMIVYNLGFYGLLGGGYAIVRMATGAQFFSLPALPGLAGLLLSPGKGLLVFTPFLLLLPFGVRRVLEDERYRRLDLCLTAGVLLELLVYCKTDWRAGFSYGPRFLTSTFPILIWLLVPAVAALGRTGKAVFTVLVLAAVAVQGIGAFYYQGASDLVFHQVPANDLLRETWRWRNAPFLYDTREGRAPMDLGRMVVEEGRWLTGGGYRK